MLTTAALKNKLKEHLTREKIDKIENFNLRIFYTNRSCKLFKLLKTSILNVF